MVGAVHSLPPHSLAVPGLLVGGALRWVWPLYAAPRLRGGFVPTGAGILALTFGGGPLVDLGTSLSATSGLGVLSAAPFALVGGLLASWPVPFRTRLGLVGVALGAILAPSVLPRLGAGVCALAALVGLAATRLVLARRLEPAKTGGDVGDGRGDSTGVEGAAPPPGNGVVSGLVLGLAVLPLQGATPLFGGSVPWFSELLAGGAVGALLASRRWPWLIAPALLVAAHQLLAGAPALAALAGRGATDGGPLAASLITILAGALLAAAAGPLGPRSPIGALAGMVTAQVTLALAPAELAAALLPLVIGLALAPRILAEPRGARRLVGALALAAPFGGLALPSAGLDRIDAPQGLYADPTRLAAANAAAPRASSWARGWTGVAGDGGPTGATRWRRGRSYTADAEGEASARMAGHLPALLGVQGRRAAILGLADGFALDALRRSQRGRILAWDPVAATRAQLRREDGPFAATLADPAVQLVSVDPLALGEPFDAIVVDLPPPWSVGGPWAWSSRRLATIAARTAPTGVAVIRIPLKECSGDELGQLLLRVANAFEGVLVWLDPTGGRHLLVTARHGEQPVDASAVAAAWRRPAVQQDLMRGALRSPADVLERLLLDRDAILRLTALVEPGAPQRAALLSARRNRRGRLTAALGALSPIAVAPASLVDLRSLPPAEASAWGEQLDAAAAGRRTYLQLLAAWQRGAGAELVALAARLGAESPDASRDLKTVIRPWVQRARTLLERGDLGSAERELQVARGFSPDDTEVNLLLGDVLRRDGRLDSAAEHYRAVLEKEPTSLPTALGLGSLLTQQESFGGAIDVLEAAEKSHPGDATLLINLGWLHSQLGEQRPDEGNKRQARARALFQRAAALEPRRPQAHAGLALVYQRSGDKEAALLAIERAIALDPSCYYQGQRGFLLHGLGRLGEARQALRESLLKCPESPEALNALGAVEADLRNPDKARDAWRRALAIDPDFRPAKENLARGGAD